MIYMKGHIYIFRLDNCPRYIKDGDLRHRDPQMIRFLRMTLRSDSMCKHGRLEVEKWNYCTRSHVTALEFS